MDLPTAVALTLVLSVTPAVKSYYYAQPRYSDKAETYRGDYRGADRGSDDPVANLRIPEVIQRNHPCVETRWRHKQCPQGWLSQFRNADGSCTNPRLPWVGSSFQPLCRLLPAQYSSYQGEWDGPRTRGKNGQPLPSARDVSQEVHSYKTYGDKDWTVMFMAFGQFVAHDLLRFPSAQDEAGSRPGCCTNGSSSSACFPILVDSRDARYQATGGCMDFVRSQPLSQVYSDCRLDGPRETFSKLTAALDGSAIYGSNRGEMDGLRTHRLGLMKTKDDLLPEDKEGRCEKSDPKDYCFKAGDVRVNASPTLAAMHVLFVRYHNLVARRLKLLNTRWGDERLFQEARRIVVALLQHITYSEYLPLVVGREAMQKYGLYSRGPEKMHTEDTKLCLISAFATAAFRFGHSVVPRGLVLGGRGVPLELLFNDVRPLQHGPRGLDLVLQGTLRQLTEPSDSYISASMREYLFEKQLGEGRGLDIAAINTQRGRDHGLPPYNDFRRVCGLPPLFNFSRDPHIGHDSLDRLARVYSDVEDVDLYPGGMSEDPLRGGSVGPTFACVIARQFQLLKFGDSFWFENQARDYSLSSAQIAHIKKMTLSGLICEVTSIKELQTWAFKYADPTSNLLVACEKLRALNLEPWRTDPRRGRSSNRH